MNARQDNNTPRTTDCTSRQLSSYTHVPVPSVHSRTCAEIHLYTIKCKWKVPRVRRLSSRPAPLLPLQSATSNVPKGTLAGRGGGGGGGGVRGGVGETIFIAKTPLVQLTQTPRAKLRPNSFLSQSNWRGRLFHVRMLARKTESPVGWWLKIRGTGLPYVVFFKRKSPTRFRFVLHSSFPNSSSLIGQNHTISNNYTSQGAALRESAHNTQ